MPAQNQDVAANEGGAAHSTMALLVADTDATQSYVFESNKLPEIRGASQQLDDLNDAIRKLVEDTPGSECIYAGGGSLLALAPVSAAPRLVAEIEARYPRETGAATITAAYRPLPPDYRPDQFGQVVTWASYWLRRRKESKAAPPFFEALPFQTRDLSSQLRPAVVDYLHTLEPLSPISYKKRAYKQNRARWFERFEKALAEHPAWHQAYYGQDPIAPCNPQTIDEISQAGRPRDNFAAFVYLDGDGIGKVLQAIHTKEQYKAVSQALDTVTSEAVFQALAAHLQPAWVKPSNLRTNSEECPRQGGKIGIHPFEVIAIGGDDVLLIVPASVAIPIALDIGERFGQEMTGQLAAILGKTAPTVSMSAAVIMADNHTPIQLMRELAEDLLKKHAKRVSGGGIDFQILKSVDMLDDSIEKVRDSYPYLLAHGDKRSGKPVRLLARPYSYPQMRRLWNGLQQLKQAQFRSSQMNMLAESLLDGRAVSTLFYQYQQQRMGETHDMLAAVLSHVQAQGAEDPSPWQIVSGEAWKYQTALWDLAELYEFVA